MPLILDLPNAATPRAVVTISAFCSLAPIVAERIERRGLQGKLILRAADLACRWLNPASAGDTAPRRGIVATVCSREITRCTRVGHAHPALEVNLQARAIQRGYAVYIRQQSRQALGNCRVLALSAPPPALTLRHTGIR